jgi:hypothetical protein
MGQTKREKERAEGRRDAVRIIATEERAVVRDEASGEFWSNEDPDADKRVYGIAFQDWAAGKIDGAAVELFETIKEVLEL